ncbi:MAG: chloride channel protein [Candidatus Methylomirabilales bacterium]
MKSKVITEESVMFLTILRWLVLATLIGVIVGLSTTLFLKVLDWSITLTTQYRYYFILLPIALFSSILLTQYFAPDAEGHGTEKVIEAVHKRSGKMHTLVVPVKFVTTIITLALGGSVGKEGPCAQIGGGLASIFADLFRFDERDRKKLVVCGISAGFASVFGTPIAGAIFGVEVLFVGSIVYDVLLPSFVAGLISYQVSASLGITYFHHPIEFVPVFSQSFFIKVVIAGIFFGICSVFLIEVLKIGKKLAEKGAIWAPWKGMIGGAGLVALSLLFSRQYLGLGLETIETSLAGGKIIWYAFILKAIFTSITLNFGGSGGIVTPIFFIGATSGIIVAEILNVDPATFAAIGLVSLLAGAANTPIAASILAVEYFGTNVAPYAAVACVVSFVMTGHRSVYPSQVLAIEKSRFIEAPIGEEVDKIETHVRPGNRNIRVRVVRLVRVIKEKIIIIRQDQ